MQCFRFLELPAEVRLMIYRLLLVDPSAKAVQLVFSRRFQTARAQHKPAISAEILRVSRFVYTETLSVLYGSNKFDFSLDVYHEKNNVPFAQILGILATGYLRQLALGMSSISRRQVREGGLLRLRNLTLYFLWFDARDASKALPSVCATANSFAREKSRQSQTFMVHVVPPIDPWRNVIKSRGMTDPCTCHSSSSSFLADLDFPELQSLSVVLRLYHTDMVVIRSIVLDDWRFRLRQGLNQELWGYGCTERHLEASKTYVWENCGNDSVTKNEAGTVFHVSRGANSAESEAGSD